MIFPSLLIFSSRLIFTEVWWTSLLQTDFYCIGLWRVGPLILPHSCHHCFLVFVVVVVDVVVIVIVVLMLSSCRCYFLCFVLRELKLLGGAILFLSSSFIIIVLVVVVVVALLILSSLSCLCCRCCRSCHCCPKPSKLLNRSTCCRSSPGCHFLSHSQPAIPSHCSLIESLRTESPRSCYATRVAPSHFPAVNGS